MVFCFPVLLRSDLKLTWALRSSQREMTARLPAGRGPKVSHHVLGSITPLPSLLTFVFSEFPAWFMNKENTLSPVGREYASFLLRHCFLKQEENFTAVVKFELLCPLHATLALEDHCVISEGDGVATPLAFMFA